MDKQNAIEVRNMSKQFKVNYDKAHSLKEKILFWKKGKTEIHQVLKNINLDIKKGETVALIGTNGSGKSTLLKLMTKIIFPNQGTIETNGKLTSLLELGAGFHQDFTGRENIYFNASIFGLTRKDIDERIDDIIAFSELGEFIDHPIRTYSSGMYMRLAFSVAINVNAEILLIDEILAVGDQHFQNKCYSKLQELKKQGKTIVIVTHSLDVVKDLCDRAIWIYKGNCQLDGDPAYVIDEYLRQVSIDHKEKTMKAVQSGKHKNKGIVFIDLPKDFSRIEQSSDKLICLGWQISDCDKSKLKVFIDNEEIKDVERTLRKDVYEVYLESYAGFMDENTIGWQIQVVPQKMSKGNHTLNVQCFDDENNILSEKSIQFTII